VEGDAGGCMSTKHKAKVNVVGGLVAIAGQASRNRKRKAEDEIERPTRARCENYEQRYNLKKTIVGRVGTTQV
jgi:hypothetical protein